MIPIQTRTAAAATTKRTAGFAAGGEGDRGRLENARRKKEKRERDQG